MTLVTGPVSLTPPMFVQTVPVVTAAEMYEAVMARAKQQDIIIKAAAVADYRPAEVAGEKIKKDGDCASLALEKTTDILQSLAKIRQYDSLRIFDGNGTYAGEFQKKAKAEKSRYDCCKQFKAGRSRIGVDTNVLTLITADRKGSSR